MAILRLFSALRERRGVPNRKKVAKSSLFLFLRLADRRDGTNPANDESHTHRNQGMHLQSDKNRPKAVSFSNIWLGQQDSRALRALSPLAQAPADKSLKACHRHVFFTGFHLIGSNPLHPARQQKNRPKAVSFSNIWLGQQDSNLHNWYQKPGSCHWTMAQRMP